MKEHIKAAKIELSDEEVANQDTEFKTLMIRMLTDLVESVRKTDEKMKPMLRETKENVQGTNGEAKETGTQINGFYKKEEINSQQNRMKKQKFQKMRRGLRTSRTS